MRQERVIVPEHILRHAVDAAEIAAVGDRNAQVAQQPPARIGEQSRWAQRAGTDSQAGGAVRAGGAQVGDGYDFGHCNCCMKLWNATDDLSRADDPLQRWGMIRPSQTALTRRRRA